MLGEDVYTAEKIMQKRKKRGKVEYLVKWRGYSTKSVLKFIFTECDLMNRLIR